MTLDSLDKNKVIHMIGIGGVSMSGLAEIIYKMGFKVTGSDRVMSDITNRLVDSGITVYEGHNAKNVEGAQLVVYTAAVKTDNPEYVAAINLGIPLMERSEFLGEITRKYSESICICGTHGKTTTTSMTSLVFIEANMDPTIQVGADLKQIDGNYRVGTSPYFVVESCEYVESFLKFYPKTAILLNIEEDHLDYYKDINHIKSAFKKFVELVPENGNIVVNADDDKCLDVIHDVSGKIITIGINNHNADWLATNIVLNDDGCYSFTAQNADKKIDIKLNVVGYHNVYNALATVAVAIAYGIDEEQIKNGLSKFTGASRRFEYRGLFNGAKVYDDYAHHPTEIKATINSALAVSHNKLWVIFQPHTYSRTLTLFDEFAKAFEKTDEVILTDIYAAREIDDGSVSSEQLAIAINDFSNNCTYISKFEKIKEYLNENVKENDLIITIGAGNITKLSHELTE